MQIFNRETLQTIARNNAKAVYIGDNQLMCRVMGKYTMFVDSRDLSLAPHLALDGFWEAWITVALGRTMKAGFNCIDVGANFGYYTIFMAELSVSGKVWAVEPNPRLCDLLWKTIGINGYADRVELVRCAVGAAEGEATLAIPEAHFGGATILPTDDDEIMHERKNVRVSRLDDVIPEEERIDFIKMDAEGAEGDIWDGMPRILENPDIEIIMEFSPQVLDDKGVSTLEKIQRDGFHIQAINGESDFIDVEPEKLIEMNQLIMLYLARV